MSVPDSLTVDEAARVLRRGRSAAYELTGRYLASGRATGLPVIRVGRLLRVPRVELEMFAATSITDFPATRSCVETTPSNPAKRQQHQRLASHDPQLPLV